MTDLPALLTRLRAATGPDRMLDADICVALQYVPGVPDGTSVWAGPADSGLRYLTGGDVDVRATEPPALTGSIDAAVALMKRMLPGWEWSIGAAGEAWASINATVPGDDDPLTDFDSTVIRRAPTPAIALLSAAIEALMAREGGDE